MERLERAVLALEVLGNSLTALEGDLVGVEVQNTESVVFKQMLHHDVNAVVSQFVLLKTQLLQAHVVLEHFTEVNRHTLTDRAINWVVNVQLLQGEIARVEHREDTDDSVMINLVVSKTERDKLIVSEKQFSDHHSATSLYFVQVEV